MSSLLSILVGYSFWFAVITLGGLFFESVRETTAYGYVAAFSLTQALIILVIAGCIHDSKQNQRKG